VTNGQPALARPLGACLITAVAWWTGHYVLAAVSPEGAHGPLAIGVASLAGFGLVGLVAARGVLSGRQIVGRLRVLDLAPVVLLLPAYPLGAALQHLAGGAVRPTAFEAPGEVLVAAVAAAPLSALVAFLVVLPAIQEWFFRGLLLPGLVRRLGGWRGLLLVSALSAAVLAGGHPWAREWVAVAASAFFWSLLLGGVRLTTGSLAAAVLLRAGLAAQWTIAHVLLRGAGSGGLLLLPCAASVAAGLWLLFRRVPAGADAHADAEPAGPASATPRRLGFPTVGIALGAGLLVAECVVVLRGVLESFAGTGIWKELSLSLAAYVVAGATVDLLLQLGLPRRLGRSPFVRATPILVIAFFAERSFGAWGVVAFGVVPAAAAFAWAAHVRWARPLAAAMALLALLCALPARSWSPPPATRVAAPAGAPSFVVVVLDTVRRDHCSLYGYRRRTTPFLETLARRGVRFDRAYSASCWSVESHASLFTGVLPHNHGATFEHMRLDERFPTLASVLEARGWDTAAFSANPYVTAGTGMARGFSVFHDLWRPFVMRRGLVAMQVGARLRRSPSDKGGAAVVAEVRRWLARRDVARPYLLFVNFMEAHSPYQDAPRYRAFADAALSPSDLERIGRESHEAQWLGTRVPDGDRATTFDLLDGATASADAYLGEILAAVGDGPNVVVLSDHGDLVGEHDLYGHMTGLYEPLIRVPLVMAGPGLGRGTSVAAPVSTLDVMPTLLALAGVPAPKTDGMDLLPALRGGPLPAERPMVAEHYRNPALVLWERNRPAEELTRLRARKMAVVLAARKRVVAEDGSDAGYDLGADPGELHPVPGASTGLAAAVPPVPGPAGTVEMDKAQIEMLRSLGYVK
jgi:arylsulfatase A-like enzyme